VESESVPPDVTIETTELTFDFDLGDLASIGNLTDGIGGGSPIIPPRPIALVLPEYPEQEKKRRVEGVVRVSLHIDETGRVVDAVVVENTTGSELCAAAALRAAKGTRFIPARRGGKPIPYWVTMPFTFSLPK
jgi:protein TonB